MILERSSLVLDLLEWLAREPRPYSEVMEAWRTSCPRLTIWEDTVDQGLVTRAAIGGSTALVSLTAAGRAALRDARPASASKMTGT